MLLVSLVNPPSLAEALSLLSTTFRIPLSFWNLILELGLEQRRAVLQLANGPYVQAAPAWVGQGMRQYRAGLDLEEKESRARSCSPADCMQSCRHP